jgi:2-hydroxychromene-2-carboxylate isomerase
MLTPGLRSGARVAKFADRRLLQYSHATSEAIRSGIWGSPFVIVDGEPFWGEDRLDQVDIWLQRGGW